VSGPVFAFVVAVVLSAFAGGYVWGWLNGSDRAAHAPQKCRDMLKATEQAAARWRGRAVKLEDEIKELKRGKAEHERAETATVGWLLEQLEEATAAAAAREPIRDLEGAPAS
jgi:hypothetical protein